MSVLKFECPACEQNLECDRACSGDVIHCPRCCAEIRIPFGEGIPGALLRAELIMHAAPPPAKAAASQETTNVTCPVCQSHLRITPGNDPAGNGVTGKAEVIRKGPIARQEKAKQPAPSPPKPEQKPPEPPPGPDLDHMPLEERERQIAAAREAHPVQLYPSIKPRLDYIRSGGEAPAPPKPPEEKPDDKSFPE